MRVTVNSRTLAIAGGLLLAIMTAGPSSAQKPGGVLRMPIGNSPASMSIHEEATRIAVTPMMAVFNNLVLFDQHIAQNTFESIRPDLAESWSWDEDKTALTFRLRRGVKWHDGTPFTAKDVQCTWDLITGKSSEQLRVNPRRSWYRNLAEVTVDGDSEVTFHLQRPQPSLLALLASGASPVYPCHVSPARMRQHPIGTGPFKFVEFKPNESIKVTRNPKYWKPGRPYLDGIEYSVIPNLSTQMLAFAAGKFDMTFPFAVSIPLLKDVKSQVPQAICELVLDNGSRTMIVNRAVPPFDSAELRRAMALSIDRKAFVDILTEGQGAIGGAMLPPPEGVWGMPPDVLMSLPIYATDMQSNRGQARALMEKLGYGPANRLAVTVSTRNVPAYRDSAVLMIDQLKEIYIDGQLEPIETANWFPKVIRRDYSVGFTVTETALDDSDQMFYENYVCGAERNYTGYCNPEFDKLVDRQSIEADTAKRRDLVWQIERRLAEEMVRPVIFYTRAASCWLPQVKGLTIMVNSLFNGWRFEDIWLDK
jgi:peptide/nickel transport system substrate-binding protein